MAAAAELAATVGAVVACQALDVARASFYRLRRAAPAAAPVRPAPPRALTAAERHAVLEALHSERFVDTAPAEVYATLLDEGTYHCSPRTMYRVLAAVRPPRWGPHPGRVRPRVRVFAHQGRGVGRNR